MDLRVLQDYRILNAAASSDFRLRPDRDIRAEYCGMVYFSSGVDRHRCLTDDLIRLDLGMGNQRWGDATVVVEVEELGEEFVLVPLYRLIEVFIEVELVDESFLFAKDRHQNVLDTDLELSSVNVAEVLFEPFKPQVILLCAFLDR